MAIVARNSKKEPILAIPYDNDSMSNSQLFWRLKKTLHHYLLRHIVIILTYYGFNAQRKNKINPTFSLFIYPSFFSAKTSSNSKDLELSLTFFLSRPSSSF